MFLQIMLLDYQKNNKNNFNVLQNFRQCGKQDDKKECTEKLRQNS